jgi:hypothetical protein
MIRQQLRKYEVFCAACGFGSREQVEATDQVTAENLFYEHHSRSDPTNKCPLNRFDIRAMEKP